MAAGISPTPVFFNGKTSIAHYGDKLKYETMVVVDQPGVHVINPKGTKELFDRHRCLTGRARPDHLSVAACQPKLIVRVRRIVGQVYALEPALEAELGCGDVLMLGRVPARAVNDLTAEVLEDHIRNPIEDPDKENSAQAKGAGGPRTIQDTTPTKEADGVSLASAARRWSQKSSIETRSAITTWGSDYPCHGGAAMSVLVIIGLILARSFDWLWTDPCGHCGSPRHCKLVPWPDPRHGSPPARHAAGCRYRARCLPNS